MRKLFLVCLLALGAVAARAEVFYGIEYFDSLGDIKKKYPNAAYEKLNPAWLTPDEAFIKVSGDGMPNELRISFLDRRAAAKNALNTSGTDNSPALRAWINLPENDALAVMWVRVVYSRLIPIETFKKKYGKLSCKTTEDFDEVCNIPGRAITASLTQDGKFVMGIETTFTEQERKRGLQNGNQLVPAWRYSQ